MSKSEKSTRLDNLIFIILVGAALAIYALTLAPTVLFADGGEFQFVPWLPGIAHPTGYPLYTLAGWLFARLLPMGEVAWRLNFFSAVAGALTVGVVYRIARRISIIVSPTAPTPASQISAVMAALVFAFSHTFWSQAVIAEVYSLHALFVALIVWACIRIPPAENNPKPFGPGGGYLLALLFGLSLTHHRTMFLMLPAILLYLWFSGYRKVSRKEAVYLLLPAALPALLYLYLPLIAPTVPYIQLTLSPNQILTLYDNSAAGFIRHITGGVFSAGVQPVSLGLDRFSLSLSFLRQQVGWAGLVLGLIGLYSLRKHPPLPALTLLSFIGFLLFNLIYFIGDVYVLFIPCWLILSLWIGLAWLNIAQFIAARFVARKSARVPGDLIFAGAAKRMENRMERLLTIAITVLGLIYPIGLLATRYAEIDQSNNTIARDAWLEILAQPLPQNAILLSNDRNEIMPLWYYQYVQGRRPDLLGLFPLITETPEIANIGRLLDEALASNRPVYLIKQMPGLEIKADLKPLPPQSFSQLALVSQPKQTPDQPVNLNFEDTLTVAGYDLIQAGNTLTVTLYWQTGNVPAAENYTAYLHLLDANGNGLTQSQDRQLGGVYYPTTLWSPGEILRDTHTLTLPANLPPGEYSLATGLYFQPEPGKIENLGTRQVLTAVNSE